jgi:hypothetical protein
MSSNVKTATKKSFSSKYSREDIAIGVLIGFQCVLALTVIIYHLI